MNMKRILACGALTLSLVAGQLWAASLKLAPLTPATAGQYELVFPDPNLGFAREASDAERLALRTPTGIPVILAKGQLLLTGQGDSIASGADSFWVSGNRVSHFTVRLLRFSLGELGSDQALDQQVLYDSDGQAFSTHMVLEKLLNSNQYGLIEVYLKKPVDRYVFLSESERSSKYNPDPQQYTLCQRFYVFRRGGLDLAAQIFPSNVFLVKDYVNEPIRLTAVAYDPNTNETVEGVPIDISYADAAAEQAVTGRSGEAFAVLKTDAKNFADNVAQLLEQLGANDIQQQAVPVSLRAQALQNTVQSSASLQFCLLPSRWHSLAVFGKDVIAGKQQYPNPKTLPESTLIGSESHIQDGQILWARHQFFVAGETGLDAAGLVSKPGKLIVIKSVAVAAASKGKMLNNNFNASLRDQNGVVYPVRRILPTGVGFYVPAEQRYTLQVTANTATQLSISEHWGASSRWLGQFELAAAASRDWDFVP